MYINKFSLVCIKSFGISALGPRPLSKLYYGNCLFTAMQYGAMKGKHKGKYFAERKKWRLSYSFY